MLETLRSRFARYSEPLEGGEEQSAILAPITDDRSARLVLTRRSKCLRRHAGEVAFPGGAREQALGEPPLQAALRESREEIALPSEKVEILGRMPRMHTRFDLWVAPFVGLIPAAQPLCADPRETESIFLVPLDFFCEQNLLADEYPIRGTMRRIPRFVYGEYDIWGFTAQVIVELCRIGAGIELDAGRVAPSRVRRLSLDKSRS